MTISKRRANAADKTQQIAQMSEKVVFNPADFLLSDTTKPRRALQSKVKAYELGKHAQVIKEVGERLRRARELNSLSLVEAAQLFGFSKPASVSKLETAKHVTSIPVWFLVEAARVYEVSADYLLGLNDELTMQSRVQFDRESSMWIRAALERSRERDLAVVSMLREEISGALTIERDLTICIQEVERALEVFVTQNPAFETEMRGSARLKRTVDEAMSKAAHAAAQLSKFKTQLKASKGMAQSLRSLAQMDLLDKSATDN